MRFPALIAVLLVLFAVPCIADEGGGADAEFQPPADLHEGWYARIETSKGRILARLLPEQAPQSVAHFAALAMGKLEWNDVVTGETHEGHYYDGVPIHKAVASQRFEAGDRKGTGRGAPLMYVPEEGAGPVNFRLGGRLGMTRASGRRISAVQFFVTVAAQPFLTPRHPCFGSLIDGWDVARQITTVKTYRNGRPIDPVLIEKIRIFKVGDPEPLPEPVPHQPKPMKFELREEKKRD